MPATRLFVLLLSLMSILCVPRQIEAQTTANNKRTDEVMPATGAAPALGLPPVSVSLQGSALQTASDKLALQAPVFIENKGQFDSRVKFLVKGNGANLWLTDEGIVFDLQRAATKQPLAAAGK